MCIDHEYPVDEELGKKPKFEKDFYYNLATGRCFRVSRMDGKELGTFEMKGPHGYKLKDGEWGMIFESIEVQCSPSELEGAVRIGG